MSRLTYRHTIAASYLGYITQAIVNNLAPLLFVTFMSKFSLTLEQITMMTVSYTHLTLPTNSLV